MIHLQELLRVTRQGSSHPALSAKICLSCLFLIGTMIAGSTIGQTEPSVTNISFNTVSIDSFSFRVPNHLELEKISDTTLCQWPIVATWDGDGNLVIAESAGVKQPVQEQLKTRPHRIVRLLDSDRDGRFDARQVVASDLAFPEGVLCQGNDIYVSAPPEIWKLTDADRDGVCEQRSVWHDGKTLTGCANDLHGPFLGPEGWLYWSKSAFAEQQFDLINSLPSKSTASHLYRRSPSASSADRVMTGGMDNLVDIAFDDSGDRYFVSTFLHHPGNGLRDGIGHAVYGSVFGKDHAVLRSHLRTGPLMKPIAELGPAAPSGLLVTSQAEPWIPSTQIQSHATMVAALFNLQKVTAHSLVPDGSSYAASTSDLVVGEQLDFHPVDVLEDVDGSLIIVDTGGWYDLCCPSSGNEERISKGGIYRLKQRNAKQSLLAAWQEIERSLADRPASMLSHPVRRVREHAMTHLNTGENKLLEAHEVELTKMLRDRKLSTESRSAAFWTLARRLVDSPKANTTPEFVKELLRTPEDPLVGAALHLTSIYRWQFTNSALVPLLQNESPTVRRLAAECLGRIGQASSVEPLLAAWHVHHSRENAKPDRMIEHSLLFALMEIASKKESAASVTERLIETLTSREASLHRKHASLHVLQQLQLGSKIPFQALADAAESSHLVLATLAQQSMASEDTHRQQFLAHLSENSVSEKSVDSRKSLSIISTLVAGYNRPDVVAWVQQNVLERPIQEAWHFELMKGLLAAYENQTLPDAWSSGLANWTRQRSPETKWLVEKIAATKISTNANEIISAISERIDSDDFSTSAGAIAMLPRGTILVSAKRQEAIVNTVLNPNDVHRDLAKRSIRRIDLDAAAWDKIADSLPTFGPIDFPGMVETLVSSRVAQEGGRTSRLLAAIESSSAAKSLSTDQVESWFTSYPDETKKSVKAMMDRVFAPPADMKQSINELVEKLEPGDAHRGQDVYRSSRAACSACHRIGYVGGNVGPELTKIGKSRTRYDFVESILFPNHRIAQGFVSTSILTDEDEVITGLITFEDENRVELAVSSDRKVSIDKKSIQQRNQSTVSLMPSGIEKVLSMAELSDLIAFLEQSK